MKVLAFDQATSLTGWAAGSNRTERGGFDFGSIRVPKREAFGERLAYLHGTIAKLIERYQPDMLAFEEPFFPVARHDAVSARAPGGRSFLPPEAEPEAAGGRGASFNAETVKQLQMVKGTIITLAALYSIPAEGYASSQWRVTLLGYGRPPKGSPPTFDFKREARKRVQALGYDVDVDDQAEAIGILMHALHGPQAAARAQGDLLSMIGGKR